MREFDEFELENVAFLTRYSIDFGLLEPTRTGLGKSIMDATSDYRAFLRRQRVHDFDEQLQGPDHKCLIPARIFTEEGRIACEVTSLYRPVTKQGDPRVWFTHLSRYCFPGDILVSIWSHDAIWVLNATRVNFAIAVEQNIRYRQLLGPYIDNRESVFEELLEALRAISAKGFIPTLRRGDTGVGHLLETELGIKANSSRTPDYKGVEIKSTRGKAARSLTLFARVPDWSISHFTSIRDFCEEFGYDRYDGRGLRLNCTVSGIVWNSQGLSLDVDERAGLLHEISDRRGIPQALTWNLDDLRTALVEKHADTFWVKAEARLEGGMELVHYHTVIQTSRPIEQQLAPMLSDGGITVDHVINSRMSGGQVREAGPLFKIVEKQFNRLFPSPILHNLRRW